MVITKIALPRRTFLRGMGATMALPPARCHGAGDESRGTGGAPFRPDLFRQRREHARVDACRRRASASSSRRPCSRSRRSATARWSSPGWITSRRRIRETSAGSIRAPRRPS